MAKIGDDVIRPMMRALDDAPVHLRSLKGVATRLKLKQHTNRDGVGDVDKFDDKPDLPSKPPVHRPKDSGSGDNGNKDGDTPTPDPDKRPYLDPKSRPSFRKKTVKDVWEEALRRGGGVVRDPNTDEIITWKPGDPRRGVWDMGHVPEAKYSEMHKRYVAGEMTPKEFRDWYNGAKHYRPETPSANRSHKFE